MAIPDIILLVVIALSAAMGLSRGLIKEVLSLASWLAAFILAMYLSPRLAEQFAEQLGGFTTARVISFGGVFIITLILASMVQWAMHKLIESTGLSGTDRILGFVFGALRGSIICIAVLIAMRPFVEDTQWWANSELIPTFMNFEEDVLSVMGYARGAVSEITEQL